MLYSQLNIKAIILLILILYICTQIKIIDDDQKLHFDDKKNRLKLENTLPQKIPENQKVTYNRDYILIATITFCILCYAKNQHSNNLQVTKSYFPYINNITKRMIDNHYCIDFLVK